tara:strand:+ start:63 stop:287 length:225 start_codon:yes stop_codon:yes gene_type:complete
MKKRFNCCVKDHNDNIIHNEDYNTLKEIGNELGLTNAMVYDLNSRKRDLKYSRFKYYPKIEINKIYDDIKEDGE